MKKLSIIGYSLGGLVARYTIGLLLHNGWFDRLEPVVQIHFMVHAKETFAKLR